MPRRLEERAPTRAFWRSHFEVWRLGGLTQRDCQAAHRRGDLPARWNGLGRREALPDRRQPAVPLAADAGSGGRVARPEDRGRTLRCRRKSSPERKIDRSA
jgi:hypothetical protein